MCASRACDVAPHCPLPHCRIMYAQAHPSVHIMANDDDAALAVGATFILILVGVALAAGLYGIMNSRVDALLSRCNLSEATATTSTSSDGGIFMYNPMSQHKLLRAPKDGGTGSLRLSENDALAATKGQVQGDVQAALGNGDIEVGSGDMESAAGSSSGAEGGDSSMAPLEVVSGFLGLHDGDLVNKVVILLQYLQMLGIFLNPAFYVSLPLVWLKCFGWIVFVNLDIGTLAVDVDVSWVSFLCSLCYQPAILFWWWAVESGYAEQWMGDHGEWFQVSWLTKEVWIQEKLQCLNVEVYDLDTNGYIRSFTVVTLVAPLVLLALLAAPLAAAAGSGGIAAVVFVGTLLCAVNAVVWTRAAVRRFMKSSYSIRFPGDMNDEHFVRESKYKELHVILLFYLAAYITPIIGFLTNISSGSDAGLAALSCLLLPTYAFGPVILLFKVCSGTLASFPAVEYQDETKFKYAIAATISRATLEWNRIRVSAKHGVEIIRNPSVASSELEPTGQRLEYGSVSGYICMLEKRDEETDTVRDIFLFFDISFLQLRHPYMLLSLAYALFPPSNTSLDRSSSFMNLLMAAVGLRTSFRVPRSRVAFPLLTSFRRKLRSVIYMDTPSTELQGYPKLMRRTNLCSGRW